MIKFGEWLPDQPLSKAGASVAKNVTPSVDSYRPMPSFGVYSDAMDNRCRGGAFFKDKNGVSYGYAGDAGKIYEIGQTLVDVSKVGGYSTTEEESWEFVQWGNQVVATNKDDDVQVSTFGDANFVDLGGSPPKAKHIAVVKNFLVLANIRDPVDGDVLNRVRWSAFEDINTWTVGTNQADFQNLLGSGGAITKIVGGEYGVIFQETGIWRMDYVGTPLIFNFNIVEPERGTSYPGSVVQYGRSIYYLGVDGFYELVDGSSSRPIGHEKVNRFFFEDFDSNYKHRMYGAVDPGRNIVIWVYPGSQNQSGKPNKAIIYNWVTGRWSYAEIDLECIFNAYTIALTLDQLDSFGTLDTIPYSFDSSVWKGGDILMACVNHSHEFGYLNGPSLIAEIETPEIGDNEMRYIRSVRPYIEGDTNTVVNISIGYRNTDRGNVTWGSDMSLNSIGEANARVKSRFNRFRVTISNGFEQAIGIDIRSRPAGRR